MCQLDTATIFATQVASSGLQQLKAPQQAENEGKPRISQRCTPQTWHKIWRSSLSFECLGMLMCDLRNCG
jgi:hypothetical protein